MKCSELNADGMADLYGKALDDAGSDASKLDMASLAPKFAELGSHCGTCPVLLKAAKTAFEARQAASPEPEAVPPKRTAKSGVSSRGLCAHAAVRRYDASGVPDLLGSPIDGEMK